MFHLERVHIPSFSVYLNCVLRYSLCAPLLSQVLLSKGPFFQRYRSDEETLDLCKMGRRRWANSAGQLKEQRTTVLRCNGPLLGARCSGPHVAEGGTLTVSNQIIVLLYHRKSASRWNDKGAILSLLQHEDVTVNGILLLLTFRHSPGYITTHRASVPEAFHSGLNVFLFWIHFPPFMNSAVSPSHSWF